MQAAARWTWDKSRAGWSGVISRLSTRAGALANLHHHADGATTTSTSEMIGRSNTDFPAFWSFLASRYTVALIICAALANRIIAIVPPNLHIPYRSSAKTRALIRLPAIMLLVRACLLIVEMLARLSDEAGVSGYRSIKAATLFGQGASGTTHADVLWSCFIAACTAVASESFVRALDRDIAATVPINLFSLGLLLHYHSLPSQDPIVPPNRQVYILLLLSLLEILSLHLIAIPAWKARLPVTATFAITSRATMLYFWLHSDTAAHTSLMPAIQSLGRILPEVFFVASSLIFIVLRALVQIITEGRLGMDIFGHSSALPHWDDDFLLALIKYGTATLETTALKGLNNEVSMLSHPTSTYVELHAGSMSAETVGTGQVLVKPNDQGPAHPAECQDPWNNEVRLIKPVTDSQTEVDPLSKNASMRKEIWRFCKALGFLWQVYGIKNVASRTGVARLAQGDSKLARTLRWMGVSPMPEVHKGQTQGYSVPSKLRLKPDVFVESVPDDDEEDADYHPDQDIEEISSEDDSDAFSEDGEVDETDEEPHQVTVYARDTRSGSPFLREPSPSYTGLDEVQSLMQEPEQEEILPVLLAHMGTANAGSPLTRRRYNRIVTPGHSATSTMQDEALSSAIAARRQAVKNVMGADKTEYWDEASFQQAGTCVVCCAEQRSIVLWPCRCLALCNECRGELAARSTGQGGSSICPCCRTPIQGYSRILIP